MPAQRIEFAGQVWDTLPREGTLAPGGFDYSSIAWFCPECGEIWARAVVEGSPFRVLTRRCGKHPARWLTDLPGSLLISWLDDFNPTLPLALWQREVLLHLDCYERNYQ